MNTRQRLFLCRKYELREAQRQLALLKYGQKLSSGSLCTHVIQDMHSILLFYFYYCRMKINSGGFTGEGAVNTQGLCGCANTEIKILGG